MMLLVILFLVGLIVAILLGKKQYRPIRGLLEMTTMGNGRRNNWQGENELDVIHKTITKVFKDHKSLSETVDLQKPYAKKQLLTKMLNESFPDEQEIESMLQALNMEMNKGPHFVAIVEFQKEQYEKELTEKKDQVLYSLSTISFSNATVNAVDLLYQNGLAFIISLRDAHKVEQQRRMLGEELQQYIQQHSPINALIVAVGTSYTKKNHINRSYIEALATLDYKFASPHGSLVFFEDLGSRVCERKSVRISTGRPNKISPKFETGRSSCRFGDVRHDFF
ncbi:hypothetical protein ACA29_24735 [Lederbergia galactosidilytica]|uniref:CdaR GGDEF-like domain-containing protein n=1 Tax=Lederbergia galactosidilytica TaxID=217031 RepID=A0A0Q9XX96_9BACI|nr:hypothetical protein ACA29_24735 [Lederbergia galactosidilytica]